MAALPTGDLKTILRDFASDISATRTAFNIARADAIAAVTAIDAWIDANAAAFNAAIPQPARSALTAKQKADLFFRISRRRLEVL